LLGVELAARSIFGAPTIAGLAEHVRGAVAAAGPALAPRPAEAEPVLSFAQQRLWFLDQFEPNSDEYNVPLGLRLRGELDSGALRRTLDRIVARHQTLRTSFHSERGEARLAVHERGEGAWRGGERRGE